MIVDHMPLKYLFYGGMNMSIASETKLKEIYHFMLIELPANIDYSIFEKNSLEEIGEYLFNIILSNVTDSKDSDIIYIINNAFKDSKEFSEINDYCKQLTSYYLGIEKLPRDTYIEVKQKYTDIFEQKYPALLTEIQSKLAAIDIEMDVIKSDETTLIHKNNILLKINKDMESTERQLTELYENREKLRTEKEMLEFSKIFLDECMESFYNPDSQNTDLLLRKIALDISVGNKDSVNHVFMYYEDIIKIVETHISDRLDIFFKVKLHTTFDRIREQQHSMRYSASLEEIVDKIEEMIKPVPTIAELTTAKNDCISEYKALLIKINENSGSIDALRVLIENCISISNRKAILLKILNLFEQGEYDLFNNAIPAQMEGLFRDFLIEGTIFPRFSDMALYPKAVLREKLQHIKAQEPNVYPEALMYFGIYFNNLIRNKIAHGSYVSSDINEVEVFAFELLLDLNYLIHMITRISEVEKMYRLISTYKSSTINLLNKTNNHFGALYNDLIGRRTHLTYDSIENLSPLKFAYWLINPYYEMLFARSGDVSPLHELRADFLSSDFWKYVSEQISSDLKTSRWNYEFEKVVKCILGYSVTAETRKILVEINKKIQSEYEGLLFPQWFANT